MPDTTPTTPAVWSDTDPLMKAIAAAVWEQCATDLGYRITCDDPRNIAAVAATTARQVLGTTDQQPATVLDGLEPVQLRWGLDDVMYGDDDTTTVLLSGPDGEPYWVELDPERTAALRNALAGPASLPEFELRGDTEIRAAVLREAADDPDGLLAKVDEATATLRRIRSTIRTLKDQGATGHAYYQAITDDLAGPRPDRDEADGPSRLADEAQQPTGCTSAPCLHPGDCGHGCRAAADELSRETQQPETEATPLAVGDRYECRARPRTVTVTRLWVDEYGAEAVAFEWRGGMSGAAHSVDMFHQLYRPAADRPDTETEAPRLPWFDLLGAAPDITGGACTQCYMDRARDRDHDMSPEHAHCRTVLDEPDTAP